MHERTGQATRGKGKGIWGLAAILLLALGLGWWVKSCSNSRSRAHDPSEAQHEDNPLASAVERERPASHRLELGREAKATITGTVRTKGGGPIAGARVCAWSDENELRGLADGLPKCTTSEHDGHYRLEGLWPVGTNVDASAAEHIPARWKRPGQKSSWRPALVLRPGEVREGVDFELLSGGAKVSGVVKDISGGEIEGALVTAGGDWGFGADGRAIGRSDEDGRFELWTKPGEVRVSAQVEGYADGWTMAFSPSGQVEIFLTPESVLVGRVVHAQTGEPVADVPVSAAGDGYFGWLGPDTVRSDGEGNFRIRGLSPGVYKPSVRADNFYGQAATQVHLGLGQTSEPVEVRVHPVAFVEGRIVKAGTDEGCSEGAAWLVRVGSKDERVYGQTDAEGVVILRGILPGEYEVHVACEGMVEEEEYPKLTVAADNIVGLVWEVREGLSILGLVVDGEGQPVADVSVSARMKIDASNARAQSTSSWTGASEADGSFELAGLLPGTYELGAWGGDRPSPQKPISVELSAGADRNDIRIELPATGIVTGRVIDEQGVGQANVEVVAGPLGERKESQTRTDDQGNFTLAHVRTGEVRVVASGDRWGQRMRKPGSTDDDEQGEVVNVEAGATAQVELVVESRNGVIRGKVFDEDGAPVDDAFVSAERMPERAGANAARSRSRARWGWNSEPHLSEADGSFVLDGLAPGKYIVRAHRKGGGEALAEDVELGSSIELTIAATGVLAGVVKVEGGEPPERFTINARDAEAGLYFGDGYFRTEGRWELRELPAGKYKIAVSSASGDAETEVELDEGGRIEDIELVLTPRVTLKGRLVDADSNAPIAGMKVTISGRSGGGSYYFGNEKPGKEISDEQGYFEVENAVTGKIWLTASPRNFNADSDYSWAWLPRTIASEPAVQDLGDIPLIATRLEPEQTAGDLGYELKDNPPGIEPEDQRYEIALVRPGGPAAAAGLAVGDVIESVDGKSVTGANTNYYRTLVTVPAGRVLELGLAGGKTISLTVGPPRK